MNYPNKVTLTEVGARDGLQNEAIFVPTDIKIAFINQLSQTGLRHIEATSFVSPASIPQLADNEEVLEKINKPNNVIFSALVPNEHGMQQAIKSGLKEIAVFTAASETFNQHNIHCSIAESIKRFEPIFALAKTHHIHVKSYISCAFGCPYEGKIDPLKVVAVTEQLMALGAQDICLSDTIGVATPNQIEAVVREAANLLPVSQLGMHLHDTYGQAIANIYASLLLGISRFDSSVAGLGGCPYAKGATGNVATEDVLYLLEGLGIETGVDFNKVMAAGDMICQVLGRPNLSKAANAIAKKQVKQKIKDVCK